MSLKEYLKTSFPTLNECYQFAKWELQRPGQRRKQEAFYKLNDEQLRALCAEQYYRYSGKTLDWNHLEMLFEKMQWAKLYDHDPRRTRLADKYAVRSWVAETIGEEYLVPLYGVWDRYQDIEWEKLPKQFVLKTSHGSGDAVIVRDKNNRTFREKLECYRKIQKAMETDLSTVLCELHYHDIPHRIIAEELLGDGSADVPDFKFFCFDGNPVCCWVDRDRRTNHCRDFYDMEWNHLPWTLSHPNSAKENPKPQNYEEMIELAKKLSKGFSFVRVDLYNLNGKIYFGEMTFTSGSGVTRFRPDEANKMLGDMWHLEMK